jgi:hypothetical protein
VLGYRAQRLACRFDFAPALVKLRMPSVHDRQCRVKFAAMHALHHAQRRLPAISRRQASCRADRVRVSCAVAAVA